MDNPEENRCISIGKMADINHTTIPTLRLYDRMGLLVPCHVDESSHYRYYDIKQNARFDMIQYMKELGMQLKEIKEILDKEDLNEIERVLQMKQVLVQKHIEDLNIQNDAITRTIESIVRYQKSPRSGTKTLEYIPKRRIYSVKTGINFYDHDLDTYEYILKELKSDLISNSLPDVYYCNAGTILKQEDFEHLNFVSDTMFVFVDRHFPNHSKTMLLEEGTYACIYSDSFDDEKKNARQLLRFCRQNHYTICGDYLCEVLMEFNVFNQNKRNMFLRLQVPVAF